MTAKLRSRSQGQSLVEACPPQAIRWLPQYPQPGSDPSNFTCVALDSSNGLRDLFHIRARSQQHVLGKPYRFLAELIVLWTMIALCPVVENLPGVKLLIV